jgi:DNA replication protein DnaC
MEASGSRIGESVFSKHAQRGDREQRRIQNASFDDLCKKAGPRYSPELVSLKTFEIYHDAQPPVLDRLKQVMAEMPGSITDGRGVLFLGGVGTGKDRLMFWLLYHAVANHGMRCKWISGEEFFGTLRDGMDIGRLEEQALGPLATPDILAISDPIPIAGRPSEWQIRQLYRLIDRRYKNLLGTWATFNARSLEHAEESFSPAVLDRLQEDAHIFECFWPSFRERKRLQAATGHARRRCGIETN